MTRRGLLALLALAAQSCTRAPESGLSEAAVVIAVAQAEGDRGCRRTPGCTVARATLASVPEGSADHAAATRLLAALDATTGEEEELAAARQAASRLAPDADPTLGLPRDAPLPAPDEVPGFLRGDAPPAEVPAPDEERVEDFGGAADGVDPTAVTAAHGFARPSEDDEAPDPALAEALPEVSRAAPEPCAKEQAEVTRRRDALARADSGGAAIALVEDEAARGALALQRRMLRCQASPDDPDCAPPPIEPSLKELEAAGRGSIRGAGEVSVGKRELDHDPGLVAAERALQACLRAAAR